MRKNTASKKEYLLPLKIMKLWGDVENSELLLRNQERQVYIGEPEVVAMRSGKNTHAAILLHFGKELHGGISITVRGVETSTLTAQAHIRFGESVGEALSTLGEKGACNDHSARDFEVTLPLLSTQEFACTGFRFVYLELLTECKIELTSMQAVFIYKPYPYVGSFRCSDERLNKIYDTAAYTAHLCLQDELWDGIKRDRLVWIGDMAPEIKTIKYVFGDVPQIISGLEGSAKHYPAPETWMAGMATYSLWWLIDAMEWCDYIGNYAYIRKKRTYITKLIRQILDNTDANGVFIDNFIDWPTRGDDEHSNISRAAAARALEIMFMDAAIKACELFGNSVLKEQCEKMRELLKDFVAPDPKDFRQIAAIEVLGGFENEYTKKTLSAKGVKGFSTFMSYYILTAMVKYVDTDTALEALKAYYGGMLDMGATTFWEDFDLDWTKNACPIDRFPEKGESDIHGDNGAYCYVGFRHSLCHGWSSGPVAFLTEHVLGINVSDGCKKAVLTPHLGSLEYVSGSIATPLGKLSVAYTKKNGKVFAEINAPEGISCTLENCEKL